MTKNRIPTKEEWEAMTESEREKWYDDNEDGELFTDTIESPIFVHDDELSDEMLEKVKVIRNKIDFKELRRKRAKEFKTDK